MGRKKRKPVEQELRVAPHLVLRTTEAHPEGVDRDSAVSIVVYNEPLLYEMPVMTLLPILHTGDGPWMVLTVDPRYLAWYALRRKEGPTRYPSVLDALEDVRTIIQDAINAEEFSNLITYR